jgi:hypothetical protein
MLKMNVVDVNWDGPYRYNQIELLNDRATDYGVYQIYGYHPLYGNNVLLYIGKAAQQTFATRILQETWYFNRDANNVEVYVGKLCGLVQPSNEVWDLQIAAVEKLLIYAHTPACNSQYINSVRVDDILDLHIFNWGNHKSLMAEVSGRRWTDHFENKPYVFIE